LPGVQESNWVLLPNDGYKTESHIFGQKSGLRILINWGMENHSRSKNAIQFNFPVNYQKTEFCLIIRTMKALGPRQEESVFKSQIVPIEVEQIYVDDKERKLKKYTVTKDEGPRKRNN